MWSAGTPSVANLLDNDRDGISNAIDPNPDVQNLKTAFGGEDYTFVILGSGRVASLQVSPALFDDLANGMDFSGMQMQDLTKKVYAHFQDVFDFIFFTSAQASPPAGPYAGLYFAVRNDVQGIGTGLFNLSSSFGSAGRLQGAIHFPRGNGLREGPTLHELCHRWGAYLASLPSVSPGHWGWCSVGGQLGGWTSGSRESLGGNQHRATGPYFGSFFANANGGNAIPYSDLELYVMGLISATGLPAIEIANDFEFIDQSAGTFSASSITTVPMSEVIAKDGARNPDHTTSQKSFRAMHVIIVKEPLTDADWARYDEHVERFSRAAGDEDDALFNFWEATGGRATLTMGGLHEAVTGAVASKLANISTRLRVGTGDNALIGGFIVTGTQPKKIIIRGIGPSLPLADKLTNPTLELRNSSGTLLDSNDDWQQSANKQAIIDSTIPPTNDLESAIVATLPANNAGYTAIVRGKDNGTGIGVVETYDLDTSADSKLANISTRGLVQTGDNVLIAGTIVVGTVPRRVIVRAIGPSLSGLGVSGALQDPILELRDGNGALVRSNDNWRSDQQAEIIATTIPPTNDLESAIVATLPSNGASYTAIVRGLNNTTGIAVVEVYGLD